MYYVRVPNRFCSSLILTLCLFSKIVVDTSGGNFNKLRKKQKFLEQLLKDNVEGYIGSNSKRDFVKEKILDKIPGAFQKVVLKGRVGDDVAGANFSIPFHTVLLFVPLNWLNFVFLFASYISLLV